MRFIVIFSFLFPALFLSAQVSPLADGQSIMGFAPVSGSGMRILQSISNNPAVLYAIPWDQDDKVIAINDHGQTMMEFKNTFGHANDLALAGNILFILDQKEKTISGYEVTTGKLLFRNVTGLPDKIKKPINIGILNQKDLIVVDASKNTAFLFDQDGKYKKSINLFGIVSPVTMHANGDQNFYVLDEKTNAITKYNVEGKPSETKLYVDDSKPGDQKGKIKNFIIDPLGYLVVWNESSRNIESYLWNEKPIKVLQTTNLNLQKNDWIAINAMNYEFQISRDNKTSYFQIKVPVPNPDNLFGFGIENNKLTVAFKQLDKSLANGYALYTADQNGNDSLACTSGGEPFVINEKTIQGEKARKYRLQAMNPSSKSDLTAGFDNFYDYGNYLKRNDKPEDAFNAYNNALRYMGRPAKMVQLVSFSLADIGKTMISRNVDMIKGLNALKTAYNLTPREPAIQKQLAQGFDNLFWRLAGQENYTAIVDEAGKVINQTFLKPYLMKSVDSIASTIEHLQNISSLSNARLLRSRMVDWAPEQTNVWKGVHHIDIQLYQLKSKAGVPDYELEALSSEAERHISRAIELLQKSDKPYAVEYLDYLNTLSLGKKYALLEAKAKSAIESLSNKLDAAKILQVKDYLASALVGQKKWSDAVAQYDYLLSQKPNEPSYKLHLADVYLANHQAADALSLFKQLLLNDPDNAEYVSKVGLTQLALNNFSEASIQLEKAYKLDPVNKKINGPLGEAYEHTNNLQKAIDQYKIAINNYTSLSKNSIAATYKENVEKLKYYKSLLGNVYNRLNLYDQAADLFYQLSIEYPKDASNWFALGNADLSRGLVYDATKAFQQSVNLEPNNQDYVSALRNSQSMRDQVSKNEEPLSISQIKIPDVFPSLYINYSDASQLPLGEMTITNNTNLPLRYSQISIEIPDIMREPSILPGGVITAYSNNTISLSSIFSDKILDITAQQKLQAKVTVHYTYSEKPKSSFKSIPVTINGRNTINWSDKRRIASFIPIGPGPLTDYALQSNDVFRNAAIVQIPDNMSKAAQIYTMLSKEKLTYTPDPDLSYASASSNTNLLDFIQYPGETILKKKGDCDDLVALFTSLLENVGIPTAMVDVPGHIFMAFDLGINTGEAELAGINARDYIKLNNKAFIPIETTLIGVSTFKDAWESAASRYNLEINKGNLPDVIALAEARKLYKASDFEPSRHYSNNTDKESMIKEYNQQAYLIYAKLNEGSLAALKNQYLYEPYNVYIKNKYAVLLGQMGRLTEAREILLDALKYSPSNPSVLNNLGNIYLQDGNIKEAIKNYEKSYSFDSADLQTVINLIKASVRDGDKESAKKWLEIANSIDPAVNEYYSKLVRQLK